MSHAPAPAPASASLPADVSSFVGVHMVSATAGWAIADAGVLYTTDAGQAWELRNPAGADPAALQPSPAGHAWSNAAFAGTAEAWVAATAPGTVTVFHTTDAGAHWSSAAVDPKTAAGLQTTDTPAVIGLEFPTAREGWLLATAGGAAAGAEDVELYGTRDGGDSWQLIGAAAQRLSSPTGLPAGGQKTGIGFASATHGYLAGYRGSQTGVWLYETVDAGRSWRPTALPAAPGVDMRGFLMTYPPLVTGGGTAVLPVTWQRSAAVGVTVFYVTADGGSSWRATSSIESPDPMQLWSWPTATDGAAASDSTWCATDTAGRSWRCEPLPTALQGISDLSMVSAQRGWAAAAGTLLATADGGHTWTPVAAQLAR